MATPQTLQAFFEAAVARHPSAPYLIWTPDDTSLTYEETNDAVDRAANAWSEVGVRCGDSVAFVLDNSPTFITAWLGLAKVGGVLAAINTGFTAREAGYVVSNAGARFVFAGGDHRATLEDPAAKVGQAVQRLSLGPRTGWLDFSEVMANAASTPPTVAVTSDDPISLIYTSGTTGRPKGVIQTHRNYVLTGEAYPYWMSMKPGERIYACLPLFHINSQAYSTFGAIGVDGALVLAPRFSARRFWDDVRRHDVNAFNFIGAMSTILAKAPPSPDDRKTQVHTCYGVPALPSHLRDELERRFDLRIRSGFGMSETTFGLIEPANERTLGPMGHPRHHPDPAIPRTEVRLVDEAGNDVADGVTGELLLRNATMMTGYHDDPEATAAAFTADGWLRTGDQARRCADGSYAFVDRKKDLVRRRGENVSSAEVEGVIAAHPQVHECAVIGVPSELTDEELLVYVVPRAGMSVTAEEILEWCQPRLAPFKIPRFVAFLDDLPKTPTAKIEKHRLRARNDRADWFDAAVNSR